MSVRCLRSRRLALHRPCAARSIASARAVADTRRVDDPLTRCHTVRALAAYTSGGAAVEQLAWSSRSLRPVLCALLARLLPPKLSSASNWGAGGFQPPQYKPSSITSASGSDLCTPTTMLAGSNLPLDKAGGCAPSKPSASQLHWVNFRERSRVKFRERQSQPISHLRVHAALPRGAGMTNTAQGHQRLGARPPPAPGPRAAASARAHDARRDACCQAPPAQIRTCPIQAFGSHLGCVTAKRWSGQG